MSGMRIGALAKAARTLVETIRYYEREGLLPAPPRSDANYREYGGAELERLLLIRRCRSLDMSLDEVRELLRIHDEPGADCGEVNNLLDGHIAHVRTRISELQALARELERLRAGCTGPQRAGMCGILTGLQQGEIQSGAVPSYIGGVHSPAARKGVIEGRKGNRAA